MLRSTSIIRQTYPKLKHEISQGYATRVPNVFLMIFKRS